MLEVLLGADDKRKMRLHRKTNAELFLLYESQLARCVTAAGTL
jgi:hypothetical protein